jgi:hypothetical protein
MNDWKLLPQCIGPQNLKRFNRYEGLLFEFQIFHPEYFLKCIKDVNRYVQVTSPSKVAGEK